jgi:lipopolysaccharide/colanic/teichoic acid biosynthesis glycosyltransferase
MLKRVVDGIGALVGLVVLSPVLAVVALLVGKAMGRPVLFRQERIGLHEQPFTLIKFRTMTEARGPDGALLPDEDRLTPLGRRLRASSLDELPELWNVLRGDMSLVGPRPLPVAYQDRFSTEENARHEVRPGITGWSQIHGRNAVDWDQRLAMDAWYARHRNWWLDLRILARTPAAVLSRRGINSEGHATMHVLRPETDDPVDES